MEEKVVSNKKVKKEKKRGINASQWVIVYPVIIMAFLTWGLWWLYPNMSSIKLAFVDSKTEAFTWFNFEEAWRSFSQGNLGRSALNTLIITSISILVRIPLVTTVVYFIFKKIPGHKFFRIIFYLPAIIPAITLTGVFTKFIAVNGPLGVICNSMGIVLPNQGLLGDPSTSFSTVCAYIIWTCMSAGLLVINGTMQRIPPEIFESAQLEGCGAFRELFQIIVPLIFPTLSTLITLSLVGIIAAGGDTIMLLSKSPADNGTTTIHYWLWKRTYGVGGFTGEYNIVSATGICLTLVVVPFTIIVRKLLGKVEAVEY